MDPRDIACVRRLPRSPEPQGFSRKACPFGEARVDFHKYPHFSSGHSRPGVYLVEGVGMKQLLQQALQTVPPVVLFSASALATMAFGLAKLGAMLQAYAG